MLRVFDFKPGSKGFYRLNNSQVVPPDALLIAENCWARDGILTPLPHPNLLGTLPNTPFRIIGNHTAIKSDGTTYTFFGETDGLYWVNAWDPIGFQEIGALNLGVEICNFTTINDFAVLVGPTIAPQKITLAAPPTIAPLGGAPPANARFVLTYKGRLLLFNTSAGWANLHWSDAGLPEVWPAANVEPIGANEGYVGSGIFEYNGLVWIAKAESLWAETSGDFGNPRFEKILSLTNARRAQSIIKTPHGIVIATRDRIELFDGEKLINIGAAVLPIGTHFPSATLGGPGLDTAAALSADYLPEFDMLVMHQLGNTAMYFDMSRGVWGTQTFDGINAAVSTVSGSVSNYQIGGSFHRVYGGESGKIYSWYQVWGYNPLRFKTPHIPISAMGVPNAVEGVLWDVWVKLLDFSSQIEQPITLRIVRDRSIEETYVHTVTLNELTLGPSKWIKLADIGGHFREISIDIEMPVLTLASGLANLNGIFGISDIRIRFAEVGQRGTPRPPTNS